LAQFRPLAIQVDCPGPIVEAKILEREFALPILKRAVAAETKQRTFIVSWWRVDAHNQASPQFGQRNFIVVSSMARDCSAGDRTYDTADFNLGH
jgi:hypothetical protein